MVRAIEKELRTDADSLSKDWHESIRQAYRPLLRKPRLASNVALALITDEKGGGSLNVAPSLSPDGSRLAFTVHEGNEYRIYAMKGDSLEGVPYSQPRRPRTWTALPPVPRSSSRVASWLEAPRAGLPQKAYPVEEYEADLDLDYVGRPYLVGGADRFGSFLGGGIGFLWSDMLGNHNLGVQGQIMGPFEDAAGAVGYTNLASRWSWGGSVSHIPFRSRRFTSAIVDVDGEVAQFERLIELRQTESRVFGFVAYPFNRARRLEFSSGFTHYAFSRQADVRAVSLETGQVIVDDTVDLEAPSSLELATSSAALVYDTAVLGPTSPLLGTRYRFEAGADYGSLQFCERARRFSAILHAQDTLHDRHAAHAFRTLWRRCGRRAIDGSLPRLPQFGTRVRDGLLHSRGMWSRRRLPGVRPVDW